MQYYYYNNLIFESDNFFDFCIFLNKSYIVILEKKLNYYINLIFIKYNSFCFVI